MSARFIPFLLAATLLGLPTTSRGGFIVTASGGSLTTGGASLSIPVRIASDASDSLGQFTLAFTILPSGSNAVTPVASLAFVGPGSYDTDPTLNDASYLYNASNPAIPGTGSFKYDTGDVFGTASDPDSIGYANRFVGSDIFDGVSDSADVSVNSTGYLIANLVVTFPAATTTNPLGDRFDLMLDTAHSSFLNGAGTSIGLATSSSPRLATIFVSAATVPEPATSTLLLFGLATLVAHSSLRRRRCA